MRIIFIEIHQHAHLLDAIFARQLHALKNPYDVLFLRAIEYGFIPDAQGNSYSVGNTTLNNIRVAEMVIRQTDRNDLL